jgi:hypothetical protein
MIDESEFPVISDEAEHFIWNEDHYNQLKKEVTMAKKKKAKKKNKKQKNKKKRK